MDDFDVKDMETSLEDRFHNLNIGVTPWEKKTRRYSNPFPVTQKQSIMNNRHKTSCCPPHGGGGSVMNIESIPSVPIESTFDTTTGLQHQSKNNLKDVRRHIFIDLPQEPKTTPSKISWLTTTQTPQLTTIYDEKLPSTTSSSVVRPLCQKNTIVNTTMNTMGRHTQTNLFKHQINEKQSSRESVVDQPKESSVKQQPQKGVIQIHRNSRKIQRDIDLCSLAPSDKGKNITVAAGGCGGGVSKCQPRNSKYVKMFMQNEKPIDLTKNKELLIGSKKDFHEEGMRQNRFDADIKQTMLQRLQRVYSTKKLIANHNEERSRRLLPQNESSPSAIKPLTPKVSKKNNLLTQLLEHKLGQKLETTIEDTPHPSPTNRATKILTSPPGNFRIMRKAIESVLKRKRSRPSPPLTPRAKKIHCPIPQTPTNSTTFTLPNGTTALNIQPPSPAALSARTLFRNVERKNVPHRKNYMKKSQESEFIAGAQIPWGLDKDVPFKPPLCTRALKKQPQQPQPQPQQLQPQHPTPPKSFSMTTTNDCTNGSCPSSTNSFRKPKSSSSIRRNNKHNRQFITSPSDGRTICLADLMTTLGEEPRRGAPRLSSPSPTVKKMPLPAPKKQKSIKGRYYLAGSNNPIFSRAHTHHSEHKRRLVDLQDRWVLQPAKLRKRDTNEVM